MTEQRQPAIREARERLARIEATLPSSREASEALARVGFYLRPVISSLAEAYDRMGRALVAAARADQQDVTPRH